MPGRAVVVAWRFLAVPVLLISVAGCDRGPRSAAAEETALEGTALMRAEKLVRYGQLSEGLSAYADHLAAGGAAAPAVLELAIASYLSGGRPADDLTAATLEAARLTGTALPLTKVAGIVAPALERRRVRDLAEVAFALGRTRRPQATALLLPLLPPANARTGAALGEAWATVGGAKELALLDRFWRDPGVLYGLVMAHRIAPPEQRRILEKLVRSLRTLPAPPEASNHRTFALAALGDPVAVEAVRVLVARVGTDNGEYEDWASLVPAIAPAFCRRLLRLGVRDSEFDLAAALYFRPSPSPELDGCLRALVNTALPPQPECDNASLLASLVEPGPAARSRIRKGQASADPSTRSAYRLLAFGNGLDGDATPIHELLDGEQERALSCEDAGWAVLARRPTEANLAVLRRALASEGPLVYVAARAMAADPRAETAALLFSPGTMDVAREADFDGEMDHFIRWWLRNGRPELALQAALELAKAERGANYFAGMRWLAGHGSDPRVEKLARDGLRLGLQAQILSAVILWSRG